MVWKCVSERDKNILFCKYIMNCQEILLLWFLLPKLWKEDKSREFFVIDFLFSIKERDLPAKILPILYSNNTSRYNAIPVWFCWYKEWLKYIRNLQHNPSMVLKVLAPYIKREICWVCISHYFFRSFWWRSTSWGFCWWFERRFRYDCGAFGQNRILDF